MPFSLRSCFGNEALNDDGDPTFPCEWLQWEQNYSLQASDFDLTYDGSNGVDTTQRTIAEALFQQDSNSADLVNFQSNPTSGTAFDLKAHGENNATSFVLKQGADLIDYELWIKAVGGTETQIIPMNSYQNWLGSISKDCQNNIQNNMELEVRIQSGSLTNTSAGVYKDTVTIIVEAV
ncbi:hypothetical protein CAPTEDRAFT_200989 [Capitella teleta]|uniref:Uncharacterized protein n=1 Tax=Capitella teleta TaxID=283909 RepID=R7UH72_CAPTE|nr:hypothetical protein CAPTEDRAFT_200989 [Capitella teleta]|eukprot:ELU05438.1 hypothetical protein CAPTEDRAFT_200989 [Capitella teleta]